jgi:alkanesulfonate monooxygenase SsuD/methylene tetrahydromethanopterin reductase-like flavin-dependent oxidoreductase (luciferase family)
VKVAYGFPYHDAPARPEFLVGENLTDLAVLVEQSGFAAAWLTEHPAPAQAWRESGGHDARHLRSPALEPFDDLADLLARVRGVAAAAGRTDPVNVMYWLPPAHDAAELMRHVTMANKAQELGVNWLVVNGEGTTMEEARSFVERYREHVLVHLDSPDATSGTAQNRGL